MPCRRRAYNDSMEAVTIQRQDYKTRGTYVGTVPGVHGIARLNYKRERPDLVIAERTETTPSLEGQGVALALLTRMVEDARKEGFRIYALCTYIEDERRSHPEWADAFYVPS
jgi:predicted GNAT family acetyltransferase